MLPVVRLMVPCEDVQPRDTGQIDILGVIGAIDVASSEFPYETDFCVYVLMANGRGHGIGKLVVIDEDFDLPIHGSEEHAFDFGHDPMVLVATRIYVTNCTLPSPGVFRIDFVYNGVAIANCMIQVRELP
jgi:hypothetical protein